MVKDHITTDLEYSVNTLNFTSTPNTHKNCNTGCLHTVYKILKCALRTTLSVQYVELLTGRMTFKW